MEQKYNIRTLKELETLSGKILEEYNDFRIFLLKGDLGSGKTSMIKFLVKKLGIDEEVTSPTFSLINEYKGKNLKVFHFDLYRIKHIHELEEIGIFEYLDSNGYCFIEWPEIIEPYIDYHYIEIKLNINENNNRNVIILRS